MKIEAIIFDIDGTVYANNGMHLLSLPLFLRYGRRLLRLSKARHLLHKEPNLVNESGLSFQEYQGQLMSQLSHGRYTPEESQLQIEEFRNQWEKIFYLLKPYRSFKKSIGELKELGLKVALFSDFPIEPKLSYLGLSGMWDATLCSEDAGALKPDPRGFLAIAKAIDVDPSKILFVGNSYQYDVLGAKAAGMYCAHLKFGSAVKDSQADFTFYGYKSFKDQVLAWHASL